MKLTENIYFYRDKKYCCNTFIIWGQQKKVLIDAGKNRKLKHLIKIMKKDGLDFWQINEIWVTHVHPDHAYVASLAETLDCQVRCHPAGAETITAPSSWKKFLAREVEIAGDWWKQVYNVPTFLFRFVAQMSFGKWYPPVDIKRIRPFCNNEIVRFSRTKVKILFAPGHTDDEIGFWCMKDKILISGDLIRTSKKVGLPCFNTFSADMDMAIGSLRRYYWISWWRGIKTLAPGHGPLIINEQKRIKNLLALNIKTCQRLKKKTKVFLENRPIFTLQEIVDEIEDLIPFTLGKSEKLITAFVLAKSLGKI